LSGSAPADEVVAVVADGVIVVAPVVR
jgi:hypothetical protein